MTQSIEKSFMIDPLTTNNAIYRELLTFKIQEIFDFTASPSSGVYIIMKNLMSSKIFFFILKEYIMKMVNIIEKFRDSGFLRQRLG